MHSAMIERAELPVQRKRTFRDFTASGFIGLLLFLLLWLAALDERGLDQ
jgi:hypothetical protein